MNDNALAKLDSARLALAECKTVMETKQIADMAEAARVYLERTQASVETVNRATEIRLLAERQMGEFLKTMPKNPGGDPLSREKGLPQETTLGEIGITYKQSSNAQKLADIPAHEFHARLETAKAEGKITIASVLKKPRRVHNVFNLSAWKKQTRSVMTSWLQSVPEQELDSAADFLSKLPKQIIDQIK